jgi:hypothetical protein
MSGWGTGAPFAAGWLCAVSGKHAELVALRIREHDPGLLPLTNVRMPSAEAEEALDFGLLVVRPKVQVKTVLAALAFCYGFEDQSGEPVCSGPYFELIRCVVHHDPSERVGPPPAQHHRIHGVHDDLLPFKAHPRKLPAALLVNRKRGGRGRACRCSSEVMDTMAEEYFNDHQTGGETVMG